MGITSIGTGVFYLVSQLGMFPGTILYVYAGTELAKVESVKDIASPTLILTFTFLGIFPFLAKRLLGFFKIL